MSIVKAGGSEDFEVACLGLSDIELNMAASDMVVRCLSAKFVLELYQKGCSWRCVGKV